jgi:hypothetical protein
MDDEISSNVRFFDLLKLKLTLKPKLKLKLKLKLKSELWLNPKRTQPEISRQAA